MAEIAYINTPGGWQPNRDAGNWRQPKANYTGAPARGGAAREIGNQVHRLATRGAYTRSKT